MAGTIIYIVLCTFVSLIFIILGIVQYHAKEPVTINTGETPPEAKDLTDVKVWNRRHGSNFIILGIMLWLTFIFGAYMAERFESVIPFVFIVFIVFAEVFWVGFQHKKMKRELIKNNLS